MAKKLSENTEVALPLRNMISIVAAASIATWAYFGIVERLNNLETSQTMMKSDLEFNTEFRIKWPRGEMEQASSSRPQIRSPPKWNPTSKNSASLRRDPSRRHPFSRYPSLS